MPPSTAIAGGGWPINQAERLTPAQDQLWDGEPGRRIPACPLVLAASASWAASLIPNSLGRKVVYRWARGTAA